MRILLLLIGITFSVLVTAQQDTIKVSSLCHAYGDSIAVRWQPYSNSGWLLGKKHGYQLTRYAYRGGELIDAKSMGTFNFLPKNKWKPLLDSNTYASVPFQAAYEYSSEISSLNNINNILSKNKEEENILLFNLLYASFNFQVASVMGLGYMDKDVNPGFRYHYEVRYVNSENYAQSTPVVAELGAYPVSQLPPIDSLSIEVADGEATLRWNFIDFKKHYVAYFIEKSTDGGTHFESVNTVPFVPMVDELSGDPDTRFIYFSDDSLTNNTTYHYRIRGLSFFGDLGAPSKMVSGNPRPVPISTEPIITDVWENDQGQFEINWFFNPEYLSKIKHFNILKTSDNKLPFQKITGTQVLPNQEFKFLDSSPDPINFYKVVAVDVNDHELSSIATMGQLKDETPPAIPLNLQGVCDSTGIVNLYWSKNNELDLAGYYVYAANIKNGDYSILTQHGEVKDSFYLDTLGGRHASENNFYKIIALDFRGNQSSFSEIIKVKLPDYLPPVKPVFKRHRTQIGRLSLEWTNSSSYDISENTLQRRIKDSLDWTPLVIDSTRGTTVSYLDTSVNHLYVYEYRIQAKDDNALITFSDTLFLQPIDSRQRGLIFDFEFAYEKEKNQIKLEWDFDSLPDQVKKISLFRGVGQQKMMAYRTLINFPSPTDTKKFIDQKIKPEENYQYKIVVRFHDGTFASSTIQAIRTE